MKDLKLTEEQVNRIIMALGTFPYQDVYDIIQDIMKQSESEV